MADGAAGAEVVVGRVDEDADKDDLLVVEVERVVWVELDTVEGIEEVVLEAIRVDLLVVVSASEVGEL